MKKSHLCFIIAVCLLTGCATSQAVKTFQSDTALQEAAKSLAEAYFASQKQGEDGTRWGGISFYNLVDYRYDNWGWWLGSPVVIYRVKAGNKFGGVAWSDYGVSFRYDPKLRESGDGYLGLRISSVSESVAQLLKGTY